METKNIKTFAEHLDKRYGETGSETRIDFEIKAKSFAIGELIKEERKLANLTQEQLANKIGAKKSFI
jgi:ribosome-binding protein aMBF1 (putative translation factor)